MSPTDDRPSRLVRWLLPDLGRNPGASMDARTLYALAALLLLVQLPHLLHLPLWVSLGGAILTGLRIALLRHPNLPGLKIALAPISVTLIAAFGAVMIKLDYGYFIGRDPSVAFLFLLVAAKFAEVRRPKDATRLLCLCAFLLLTQYFYSQTLLAAIVTLPAVVALVYALAVLRDPGQAIRTNAQLRLVATLLLQGLPLAAVLFIVFPRLPGPLWSLPEDSMATTGLSDSMSPGSIGQLSQSDAVAFRVEFDGAPPAPSERYWRGPVLSEFDGRNWTIGNGMIEIIPGYLRSREPVIDYVVTLQPHQQRWLFALDSAVSLPVEQGAGAGNHTAGARPAPGIAPGITPGLAAAASGRTLGRLLSDGQLIARRPVTQVLRYRQSSILLDAVRPVHAPADNTLFLPGRNLETLAFASQLRKSVDSDLAYAQAVLRHFNNQAFYYTLEPQLLGDAPVDEFLFTTRSGFCEHYAAAFVVLMRGAGIPARVVTGYLGGEMNQDYMIVRQSDAHAWAEAYIDGAWKRFDPTGAVAPQRVQQGLSAALPDDSLVPRLARLDAGWIRHARMRWDAVNHQWQRLVIDFDDDSQDLLWQRLGFDKPALWQLTALLLAVAALWCIAILGLPRYPRSKASEDEQLWSELYRLMLWRKLVRAPSESSAEYLKRAQARWPQQAQRLQRLQAGFELLRFQHPDITQRKAVRKAVKRDMRRLRVSLLLDRGQARLTAEPGIGFDPSA